MTRTQPLNRVLVVDDDAAVRDALVQTLELADLRPTVAGSFVAAKDHIQREFDGVILSDIRMPGRDGFHLLTHARKVDEDLPVVLLTGEGDIPMAVAAIEQGAFDFLEKPCAPADLLRVLGRALDKRRSVLADRADRAQRESGDPAARMIFGVSDMAEALRARVRQAAATGTEVLVTGPAGSGISKVAEVVHLSSPRAQGPFQKRAASGLDRAGLDAALAASTGGALFVDDIARMPADTQIALNEALDAGCDVRLLAGSTSPLEPGGMNTDLFYRLQVMTVRIPSLGERPEDIPVLFRHYVAQASEQAGLNAPPISAETIAGLIAQDWPGNARALMSAAMRFALGMGQDIVADERLGLVEQMAQVERTLLASALRQAGGRASVAARALQLPRKTFYDKLTRHGLRAEEFRD